jgi:hypothetical protein
MNFFKEEKLFRVEIIKICSLPTVGAFKNMRLGCIPVGTKGWIIKKWGKEYFSIDSDQQGIDLFTNWGESEVCLIPHRKVEAFYKKSL